jgi:lipid-binding SYLF domain-containing protein
MHSRLLIALVSLFGLAATAGFTADDRGTFPYKSAAMGIKKEKDRLAVQSAFVEFAEAAQLEPYFKKCYGLAIFPTIGKGGFAVGGAHGKGWVFTRMKLAGQAKMTQVSLGFQAGGQAFRQIVFFENEDAFERFTAENFEFGAQASAAVITEGASASANTAGGATASAGVAQSKSGYTNGMAVFVRVKGGLMYEAAISGQKFSFKPLR